MERKSKQDERAKKLDKQIEVLKSKIKKVPNVESLVEPLPKKKRTVAKALEL